MATIVLQAAGAFVGSVFGPVGSAIGSAIGAMAGYSLDRALINGTRRVEGPRLTGARPFTAEEGASLPRVYGAARLGGTMIWATHFEESRETKRQGAKGGPRVTEYSYFANAAFALCEGEIAGIRRVWADGRELDRTGMEMRVFPGSEDQLPDPLIEAKQGAGNAPAYRGTAYVVIDRFPLGDYGNRIPQLQFEVLRPVGELTKQIEAVALIPGATEYGLSPGLVTREMRKGETEAVNRHVMHAGSDLAASLDELQMLCPNLKHVALVATWFGDDLRAGHCRIRPGVTAAEVPGLSEEWRVSGLSREEAMVMSQSGGGAAYGGTPSDRSIMQAVAELKNRGLSVTLYPFVMMDVPAANGLPDPYGGVEQAAYPWRGRITCDPAPGRPGSADKTSAARSQVNVFCGQAQPGDFSGEGGTIGYSGPADDWGYRRFLLHFAHLAAAAGSVDAFLIGTELRGLTTLRDGAGAFPFVEQLCALAADVRQVLGSETAITYGADWREYFGHQPGDGSGDVLFHLDALWAHAAVDAVGIDNYMPLSDWRDADYAGGNPDGFAGPYDPLGLRGAIAGGEGFDWYYPDAAARAARQRQPITDGAYDKPWVYRPKDLVAWWSNPHHDRIGGVESATPTAWVPRSKPIWLTELGCPAVDKGPNQPNVFPDPKSAESAIPHFSNGGRSDLAQRRFLEAHIAHWSPDAPTFQAAANPVSPVYGGRMLDPERNYLWAWDARPFPPFPLRADRWADGGNWHSGHWLNGRLGTPTLGDLINAILADHRLPAAQVDGADDTVHGYVVDDPASARASLEPIVELFDLVVCEEPGGLVFRRAANAQTAVQLTELAIEDGGAAVETTRVPDHDLPGEVVVGFRDPMAEYQAASTRVVWAGAGPQQHRLSFPGMLEAGQGRQLAQAWLQRLWGSREDVSFAVAGPRGDVTPGSLVTLPASGSNAEFLITGIEDGLLRRVTARQIQRRARLPWRPALPAAVPAPSFVAGPPLVEFLDLPIWGSAAAHDQLRVAVWQKPWRSQRVYASPEASGFAARSLVTKPAAMGELVEALVPGIEGRIDRAGTITVGLFDAELASVSSLRMLNGANAAAIRCANGAWEVLQFETAEEVAPDVWRLAGLLRGQLGTADAMLAGAPAGARFVVLDDAVAPAGLSAGEAGLALNWKVGPVGSDLGSRTIFSTAFAGGMRALIPLSPVHLKARRSGSDLLLSWVRRGRIDADSWDRSEVPLAGDLDGYRLEIAAAGGPLLRQAEAAGPQWTYTASHIAADFGALPGEMDLTVRQIGAGALGLPATRRLTIS